MGARGRVPSRCSCPHPALNTAGSHNFGGCRSRRGSREGMALNCEERQPPSTSQAACLEKYPGYRQRYKKIYIYSSRQRGSWTRACPPTARHRSRTAEGAPIPSHHPLPPQNPAPAGFPPSPSQNKVRSRRSLCLSSCGERKIWGTRRFLGRFGKASRPPTAPSNPCGDHPKHLLSLFGECPRGVCARRRGWGG